MATHYMALLSAARDGDLSHMRRLHEQFHVRWDGVVAFQCVLSGRLECLEYAVEHGCALPRGIVNFAVRCRNLEIVRYLLSQYAPASRDDMEFAIASGDVEMVRTLHEYGVKWPRTAVDVVESVDVMRYLSRHGVALRPAHKARIARHLLSVLRRHVKVRATFVYWRDCAARTAHAPDGPGRKRDLEAFESWWCVQ